MDVTQTKALDFMLRHTYTQIINKTLTYYLLMVVHEITDSIKLDKKWLEHELSKYHASLHSDMIINLKHKAAMSLLQEGKAKIHLLRVLDDKVKIRDDIIEEVMKQNSLDKDNEADWIRQRMIPVFNNCVKKLRFMIEKGNYDYIYGKWRD